MKFKSIILTFLLFILSCSSNTFTTPTTAEDYVKYYGGSNLAYQRILNESSCKNLQEDFDLAFKNHKMESNRHNVRGMRWCSGYMKCSDKRMEELGCYK